MKGIPISHRTREILQKAEELLTPLFEEARRAEPDSPEEKCCKRCWVPNESGAFEKPFCGAYGDCKCHKSEYKKCKFDKEYGFCKDIECQEHNHHEILRGKPEIPQEKDSIHPSTQSKLKDDLVGNSSEIPNSSTFIDKKIQEFITSFPQIYTGYPQGNFSKRIESFLREALEEAELVSREYGFDLGRESGLEDGRLAMKEEIEEIIETRIDIVTKMRVSAVSASDYDASVRLTAKLMELKDNLEAIRNKK